MFANFSSIGTLLSLGMVFSVVTFVAGCAVGGVVRSFRRKSLRQIEPAARARYGNDAFGRTGDDGLRADPRSRQARRPPRRRSRFESGSVQFRRMGDRRHTIDHCHRHLAAGDRADDLRQHRTTAAPDADRKTDRGASRRVAALWQRSPHRLAHRAGQSPRRSTTRFSENSPSGSVVARRSL